MRTPDAAETHPPDDPSMELDTVMNYVECDLDATVTLPEWRRLRGAARPQRRHPVRRMRTRLWTAVGA